MIFVYSKLIKKLDTIGKNIFNKRVTSISSQIGFVSCSERNAMEGIFQADEKSWASLLKKTSPNFKTGVESIDTKISAELDRINSVFGKKKNDTFKALKIVEEAPLKVNRAILTYQNDLLVEYFSLVQSALEIIEKLCKVARCTYKAALEKLEMYQDTVTSIRQITYDFTIPDEEAEDQRVLSAQDLRIK